ncbi:PBECR3 domain-containing polyvalent protein [Fusobacterium necrophorum]|uniref:PBECR3 domain-containing polyvalent protein n=1 Tax=Fusobacterium necrophorum TaxID=859 RepID=UPI000B23F445|nr:PBECR2 nuclease fold domain-containing protein [Fusobacterium necrophorum]
MERKIQEYKRLKEEVVIETAFPKEIQNVLEREFGKLNTTKVILRKERLQHIEERHPEVVEVIKNNFNEIIETPDYILKDEKNENTILLIRELENKAYNTVIKISVKENTELKNSTLTFYKIRDREVRRLCNISKVILTKK